VKIDIGLIEDVIEKLRRRDPVLYKALIAKIVQIAALEPVAFKHFKNLRGNLKDYKRVHVGSFVLLFKIEGNTVVFGQFKHHDDSY